MVREGRRGSGGENNRGGNGPRRRRRERSLSFSRSPSPPPPKRQYTHSRTNKKQSDRSRSPTPVMDMTRSEYHRDDRRGGTSQNKRKGDISDDEYDRRRGRGNEDNQKQKSRSRPASRDRARPTNRDRERDRDRDRERERDRGGRSKSEGQSGEKRSRSTDRNYLFSKKLLKQFNDDQKREIEEQEEEAEREEEEQYKIKYQQFLQQYDNDGDDKRHNRQRPGSGSKNDKPSRTLYIKGIKEDMEEEELLELFQGFPGIINCNIMRDKISGASRGFGFVDFSTVDVAAYALQEAQSQQASGCKKFPSFLSIEFGLNCGGENGGGSVGGAAMDWLCGMCGAVNFSRRLECYQCCAKRQKDVQKVPADPEGPTSILRVSGIQPHVSKEDLVNVISSLVDIKEVRLMKDKYTGFPRGFGFIHFYSVADAVRSINFLQGCDEDAFSHLGKLTFTYAKDKNNSKSDNLAANDALAAGQAMQNYSAWQPKEFQQSAVPQLPQPQPQSQAQPQPESQSLPDSNQQQQQQFVYDSNSGYWYDTVSGCYYDANTQLYYDPNQQQWLQYDYATSTYVSASVQEGEQQQVEEENLKGEGMDVEGATSMITSSINALKVLKQEVKSSQKKPAVIGAAPKLDPVALMRTKLLKEQNLKDQQMTKEKQEQEFRQQAMKNDNNKKDEGDTKKKIVVQTDNSNSSGGKRAVKGVIRSKSYVQNSSQKQVQFQFF